MNKEDEDTIEKELKELGDELRSIQAEHDRLETDSTPTHEQSTCGVACFRCGCPLIEAKHSTPDHRFYGCPQCQLNYEQRIGESLHDMGFSPIPVVLSAVHRRTDPENAIESAADLPYYDREGLQEIVDHIESEINEPKQNLSEIHKNLCAEESRLRTFLKGVSDRIQEKHNITPTA